MKLTIERTTLLKALGHVQSVVERRNTIPILANVMLEAADNIVSLTATDMELTINRKAGADVSTGGATTAPAHTLHDIIRKLPEGAQVELETAADTGQLHIRSGRSRFALSCLPTEDFPVMTGADMPIQFAVEAGEMRSVIDRTRFAISTEETRYYLNGIYLHAVDGDDGRTLRAVATDGHRLARVEMPLPEGAADMPGIIVPRKTVGELRKLIDETVESVEIELGETRMRFSFDAAVLTSKLIDGKFPDYERVIPVDNDKTLEVNRRQFTEAVDRVSTISTEKSRAIKLTIGDGSLKLSASSQEQGSASEELEVSYGESPLEIGFNARYLIDITQQIEGEEARFSLSDPASPTIVRDADDASALYVLMPMRV